MMKRRILMTAAAAMLAVSLLLGGCGSRKADSPAYDGYEESYEDGGAGNGANYNNTEAAYDEASEEDYDVAAEEAYAADEAAGAEEKSATESRKEDGQSTDPGQEQKLVYTCNLTIETLEFQETSDAVRKSITKYDGIIENENTSDSDRYWYRDGNRQQAAKETYMTIRIPSEHYEEFLTDLEGSGGKITQISKSVENITKSYNDQSVLIESLEKQEKRLLAMMDEAETIEDMIAVEARLTEVQTQLNQARTQLSYMDSQVSYSTIYLYIDEVADYSSHDEQSFGEEILEAIGDSWKSFCSALKDLLILFIYILPFLLLLALLIYVLVRLIRWLLKKRKDKKGGNGGSGGRPARKGSLLARTPAAKSDVQQPDRTPAEAPGIKAEEAGNSDENSGAEPVPTEQPAADKAGPADTPEKETAQAARADQDPDPEETGPDGE